jgi:peptide/nickel transport system permease protein
MTAETMPIAVTPALALAKEPSSLSRDAFRHLLQKRSAVVGMLILLVLALIAVFAPLIAPYNPEQQLIGIEAGLKKRSAPCIHALGCSTDKPQHIFGVDANFRDFFSRVIYGSRLSLQVGFASVTFAIVVGTTLGAVAGFIGGWADNFIMRLMDVPAYARVIRSSVLSVKEQDFILADRALGVPSIRILFRDILPNSITPLIVQGTLGIGTAIVEVAALSFLGLGAQPPTPEWGLMISAERNQIFTAPYLVLIPGVAIALVVLGFNLLGDGLQDALNPRLNRR